MEIDPKTVMFTAELCAFAPQRPFSKIFVLRTMEINKNIKHPGISCLYFTGLQLYVENQIKNTIIIWF